MPGLPRKDTLKRFKKFCKKSGKSRTNTMSGAYDTSKQKISTYDPGESMIIRFEEFLNENKLSSIESYFDEIIDLFREYKELSLRESKMIAQEYQDYIIKEYEKGTPANKCYKDLTYLVGDI